MKEYKNLKRVACEELEAMDKKYEDKHEFTKEDAELYKTLMKAKYYQTVTEEMEEGKERQEEMYGESFARGRGANGRYISRDGMPEDYYMSREGYSGHYPPHWYPRNYYNGGGGPW